MYFLQWRLVRRELNNDLRRGRENEGDKERKENGTAHTPD